MTGMWKRCRQWSVGLLGALLIHGAFPSAAVVGAQAQTGSVQGRVTLANTETQLPGVQVRVAGTPVTAVTDAGGRYVLTGLPAGAVKIEFTYLGFETAVRDVTVQAGAVLALNVPLTLPGVQEDVTVTAQVAALRDALNRYRTSSSLTNFVAADDIGQFVDQNVAESLQRLPGVAITRDQGEGRFVTVRGMDASLSTVSINGMRIGTPEDGSRQVPLDVIPVGAIETLEVTKTPTPDMPGDAIGGSVNVRSASAFDRSGRTLTYRLEGSRANLSGDISPKGQFTFSDVLSVNGRPTLGISFGANHLDRTFESDNTEVVYNFLDDLGTDQFTIEELQHRKYFVNRKRTGANLNLDYRPSVGNQFYVNTLFSRFTDAETRQRSIFVFTEGDLAAFDGRSGRFEDIDDGGFRRRIRFRTKEQDTLALALGGSHILNRWNLDYELGRSVTRERVLDENEGRFSFTGGDRDITFAIGSGLPTFTVLRNGAPDQLYLDNAGYTFDRVVLVPKIVDDDDTSVRGNAEYRTVSGMTALMFKTGVDLRFKNKFADVAEVELRRGPALNLSQFTTGAPAFSMGLLGPGISSSGWMDFYGANAAQYSARPQDVDANTILERGSDYEATENVMAGYVMGTIARGKWRLIPGVRVEHTTYDATGNQLTIDEDGDLSVSDRSVDSSYTNVLPGLHFRYDASERLVVRTALSRTMARPSFSAMSPRFTLNNEDLEIEAGNPDLKPYTSTNLDLTVDAYTGDSNVVSVGGFYKRINDYIVGVTTNNDAAFPGYEVSRPVNGTEASVWGVEVNVEQELRVVSEALDGFLIGANATLLRTRLDVAQRPNESFGLPLSADRAGNVFLGYERGPFSGRVSYTRRGEYLNTLGDDANFDVYVEGNTQVDFVASWRVRRGFELVMEGANLTDAPLQLYQGSKGFTFQRELYGRTFAFGIKGRF
jgi:TonB-dependent receptor